MERKVSDQCPPSCCCSWKGREERGGALIGTRWRGGSVADSRERKAMAGGKGYVHVIDSHKEHTLKSNDVLQINSSPKQKASPSFFFPVLQTFCPMSPPLPSLSAYCKGHTGCWLPSPLITASLLHPEQAAGDKPAALRSAVMIECKGKPVHTS